ncbi:hypothetical protein [Polaribacter cellanae]|uniref:Efflux RND transporter periplasmic adaptor subunit n=1 Tax=Polaribacter cellanae TaxID=2818493 RepID=A0A975CPK8_9FLAO|nr:hypothetical protein [Polaribacter cellanae]QTE23343.1 hypothetical protein J3359_03425 [Polaribacter cellanae]
MKNKILLFLLTIMLFSCNSENNNIVEPQEQPFTVELVASNTNVPINGITTFKKNSIFNKRSLT